jgi:hypothetical protein
MLSLATLLLLTPAALAASQVQIVTVSNNGTIKYSPDNDSTCQV